MRSALLAGLVTLVMFIAGSGAGAQSTDQDKDKGRANALWQQALTLYGQGKKPEALTVFRESLRLWSDEVRKNYVARLQEGLDLETAGKPAVAPPKAATPVKPTAQAPPTAPAASDPDAPAEMMPLARGFVTRLDPKILIQMREILAPFGTALHYADQKDSAEPSVLRVVFAGLDGEFLELQMGVDAKGAVTVGDVSVESLGRDPARLALILQSYRIQ